MRTTARTAVLLHYVQEEVANGIAETHIRNYAHHWYEARELILASVDWKGKATHIQSLCP
jgi:hypothetical protein